MFPGVIVACEYCFCNMWSTKVLGCVGSPTSSGCLQFQFLAIGDVKGSELNSSKCCCFRRRVTAFRGYVPGRPRFPPSVRLGPRVGASSSDCPEWMGGFLKSDTVDGRNPAPH